MRPPQPRDSRGRFLAGYTLYVRWDGAMRWLRYFGPEGDES